LTLPLLQALHEWRPELSTEVLIESPFASVFLHHPAVTETLVLKSKAAPSGAGWSRSAALLEIRRRYYPAVMNLHGGTTSLMFTVMSGAPIRIGQEGFRASRWYNRRIPRSSVVWRREGLHTVEHQLSLMTWLGLPLPANPRPTLHVNPEARERVRQRLVSVGIQPDSFLLIQPAATLFTKQWPERNFAELADRLRTQYGLAVVFTAGSWETGVLRQIEEDTRHKHHYWSDLELENLFALIEACRIYIGNDSGPTHAAAALSKPVVAVWGSSDYRVWRPWGTDFESIRSDLPCMPCPGYSCAAFGQPRCILDISVERVFEACARVLART
jgi:ADP-heptose:LPS heptosyltransferase